MAVTFFNGPLSCESRKPYESRKQLWYSFFHAETRQKRKNTLILFGKAGDGNVDIKQRPVSLPRCSTRILQGNLPPESRKGWLTARAPQQTVCPLASLHVKSKTRPRGYGLSNRCQ